jgi:hypothetical protein
MSTRLDIKLIRMHLKRNGDYFEGYHIIPKCKGGTGDKQKTAKSYVIKHLK